MVRWNMDYLLYQLKIENKYGVGVGDYTDEA